MTHQELELLLANGLENERVILTVIKNLEQVEPLREIAYQEKDLLAYSPSRIDEPNLFNAYFNKAIGQLHEGDRVPFLVFDKLKNKFAGCTSYGHIDVANNRLEIGWTWIGSNFQRTGLNHNMKFLMLSNAFDTMGCARVEFKSDANNLQSRNAMERIGAQYEGLLRSHTVLSNASRRDTVYYSILPHEWEKLKLDRFKNLV